MNITILSTYPPRECGIATFTSNLAKAISGNPGAGISLVAVNDMNHPGEYPSEVKYIINQQEKDDYQKAARYINASDADVCLLQHEFGIFGGDQGVYIIPFINRLKVPLIVTFHTVLKDPSVTKKAISQKICSKASKIIVMSHKAIHFLTTAYNIPAEKIELVEHGIPNFEKYSPAINMISEQKEKKSIKQVSHDKKNGNKKILLTFGLLSRNKGLETVIKALPGVVEKHPDILYIILGKTHPGVVRLHGEEYRDYLKSLVKARGLEKNVLFVDKFLSEEQLFTYLKSCDIYITPYLNEAQVTSGTLSYAVGAGAAVVSTPYWHAKELLIEGRGLLFDFRDHGQLSSILVKLLDNQEYLKSLKEKAYHYGLKIRWPLVGKHYIDIAREVSGKIFLPSNNPSMAVLRQ